MHSASVDADARALYPHPKRAASNFYYLPQQRNPLKLLQPTKQDLALACKKDNVPIKPTLTARHENARADDYDPSYSTKGSKKPTPRRNSPKVAVRKVTKTALPLSPVIVRTRPVPNTTAAAVEASPALLKIIRQLTNAMSVLNVWSPTHVSVVERLLNETLLLQNPTTEASVAMQSFTTTATTKPDNSKLHATFADAAPPLPLSNSVYLSASVLPSLRRRTTRNISMQQSNNVSGNNDLNTTLMHASLPPPPPATPHRSVMFMPESMPSSSSSRLSKFNNSRREQTFAAKPSDAEMFFPPAPVEVTIMQHDSSIIDQLITTINQHHCNNSSSNMTITRLSEMVNVSHLVPEPDDPMEALINLCTPKHVVSFQSVFDELLERNNSKCVSHEKIAEGSYGDVYLFVYADGSSSVLKVIAIRPDADDQKPFAGTTYKQALPEVKIATTIAATLQNEQDRTNYAPAFLRVDPVSIVQGPFPSELHKQFVKFKDNNTAVVAQNPDPTTAYEANQHYLLLFCEHCGEELEKKLYMKKIENCGNELEKELYMKTIENVPDPSILSYAQCVSVMRQLTLALAAAEEAVSFEHRDMHESNILVRATPDEFIEFVINKTRYRVPSEGYAVTIIDMTWARMTSPVDGVVVYADMSNEDELLKIHVYKSMRDAVELKGGGHWESFVPVTNVYWLGYISALFKEHVTYMPRLEPDDKWKFATLAEAKRRKFNNTADFIRLQPLLFKQLVVLEE